MASSRDAIYAHIKDVWLDAQDPNHPVALALRRGNHTTTRKLDKLVRTPGLIESLRYVLPGETEEHELDDEQKEDISAILAYRNYLQNGFGPTSEVGVVDITTKDRDDYIDYIGRMFDADNPTRIDEELSRRIMLSRARTASTTSTTSSNPTSNGLSRALELWDKGVKRDSAAFPPLNGTHGWNVFRLKFTAIAKAQQVDKVLDPTYSPAPGSDEEALLQRMKVYVYSILTENIKTSKGAAIVKNHDATMDAQEVWKELVQHHTDSIASDKRADTLFSLITGTRIPKDVTNLSLASHITEFRGYVREYNTLSDTPMDDAQELTHLKNYVSSVESLRTITNTANTFKRMYGQKLDPHKHIELYESAAEDSDAQLMKELEEAPARRAAARRALFTEQQLYLDDDCNTDADDANEDDYFEANVSTQVQHPLSGRSRGPARPMLGRSIWRAMSREGREIWSKLPDADN